MLFIIYIKNHHELPFGDNSKWCLCFVSDLFPGSTSDKEITVLNGFLDRLWCGDQVVTISSLLVLPYLVIKTRPLLVQWRPHVETQVMVDKGFNCKDELASVGASLVTPTFLDKKVTV